MYILSTTEMQNIDKRTINEFNVPGITLMENAGEKVATEIKNKVEEIGKLLIICGKGNNGGDGFVVANYFANKNVIVDLVLLGQKEELKGDALIAFNNMSDKVNLISLDEVAGKYDVIVDAIFGTGFSGELNGIYKTAVEYINSSKAVVFSVDIPSGVNGNTGQIGNICVKADYTVTFCNRKYAHYLYPGKAMCGEISVSRIGIPDEAIEMEKPVVTVFNEVEFKRNAIPTNPTDHKGTNGSLLIIGGSYNMPGAVNLCTMGALRGGTGLVTVAMPKCLHNIVATKISEAIIMPLIENENGQISKDNLQALIEKANSVNAVVIGCGMGISSDGEEILKGLIENVEKPILIDADGLNMLSNNLDVLKRAKGDIILTPHPKEMSRLMGNTTEEVNGDRIGNAISFANKYGVTVVLKGNGTIIAKDGKAYLNTSGNEGMAKAGSGDVLSGIIGSVMAREKETFMSASKGVYIHGKAGDIAVEKLSKRGMIASDIIENIPYVF